MTIPTAARAIPRVLCVVAFALECVATAASATPSASLSDGTLQLGNELISITLDAKSGSITSIVDVASGINLVSAPQGYRAMWGINQSSTGNSLSGPYTDNNASSAPVITVRNSFSEASATLVWNGLNFSTQRIGGAQMTATISVRKGDPLSHWTFQAQSLGGINATELSFPVIGNVGVLGTNGVDNRYLVPEQDGRLYLDPVSARLRKWVRYPTSYMSMQFSAFYNSQAGFYLAALDPSGHSKAFSWYSPDAPSNSVNWSLQHFFADQQTNDLTLPYEVVLGVFHGDWTAAADIYSSWAAQQTWTQEARAKVLPTWFRSIMGSRFQCTGYCGLAPQYTFTYAQSLAEDSGDQATFGGRALAWFNGWEKLGVWVFGDELPPSEGWTSFDAFVTGIHQQGNNLQLVTNLQLLDNTTQVAQSGSASTVRNKDGSRSTSVVNEMGVTHTFYRMSPTSATWQQNRIDLITTLAAHNIDIINFDGLPVAIDDAFPDDYSPGHPPGIGGNWQWLAWKQLLIRAEQAARALRPDILFSSEEANELLLPYITHYIARSIWSEAGMYSNQGQPVPAFGYVYKPLVQAIPDYWPLLAASDTETSYHRFALARAFVWGQVAPFLYGQFIGLSNSMLNVYSAIAKARVKYSRFLVDGSMLPTPAVSSPATQVTLPVGFVGGGNPYTGVADSVQASAWLGSSGEVGVALINISSSAVSINVPIDFDRLKLSHGSTYTASIESGETTTTLGMVSDTKSFPLELEPLQVAVIILTPTGSEAALNYQGLWWAAPPGSESGWGINFAHQGDTIFATWFTYDTSGKAWWLSMTANRTAANTFGGTLYRTDGPPFNAIPFNPSAVTATAIGTATLTFVDANNGMFTYTVNGVAQAKSITRQVFGPLPICTFGALSDLTNATNYQDLWWAAPAASESGWGANFTQQGDIIFVTWFTYDLDGSPMWLSATANKSAPGVYTGALNRTTGPAFNAAPFDPLRVSASAVGSLTLTFANGDAGTFAYTMNGVSQAKSITRQVFRSPGTVCQ